MTRPDTNRVRDYRRAVDESMGDALRQGRLDDATLGLVQLGLHHEQQHQELLLMDALHLLSCSPLHPAYDASDGVGGSDETRPAQRLEHDGGVVEVGHDSAEFAYDNESPAHNEWLEPFAIEDRLVTCGEWTEFIADGGYERHELWLSDGWQLVQSEPWSAPLYWEHVDDGWKVFGLHGLRPLAADEPVVHVSYHEADAFARWRGARLPTEAEWEVVAREHWNPPRRGDEPTLRTHAAGDPDADPLQFCGEVWQWSASAYLAYPGFRPVPGAVGEYNGKFMVNQQVLRGGSHATPPGHERVTYRNFFAPAARWAFSGVRIAHDN